MDENTVRLWLKDHQDTVEKLAQQQAATFQAEFDTLRVELQATRGLLQNRQGPGVIKGRCYRDLCGWTFPNFRESIQKARSLPLMNTSHCLILPLINVCGLFEESVKNRFGPSKYEDPQGALSKLLQLGTVEDYHREFEKLMNRVTDIPDSLLISFYISGLKLHLQRELLVSKPTTLGDVFSLARTTEARLDDQAAPVAGMSAGLEANKVINDGDGEVKVLNLVQQAIDVESTSDNDARDQASELKTKVLVDGKQDEAKVVKVVGVADEQNINEPNVLEGNRVIGVGRLNDKHIKKKKMEAAIQRRLWIPELRVLFKTTP
ncbi:hypothetical protein Tco_1020708 [Tanacetum coccineum]